MAVSLSLFGIAGCLTASVVKTGQPVQLTPQEAWWLIRSHVDDPDFVILDVRTAQEYAAGHIAGALLLDYRSPSFEQGLANLARGATYLVYCRSGNRSAGAVEVMAQRGFTRIYELADGILAWERAGLPVEG